ncbi:MAG: thioredoxin family protein [Phycisphaerales bacterium]
MTSRRSIRFARPLTCTLSGLLAAAALSAPATAIPDAPAAENPVAPGTLRLASPSSGWGDDLDVALRAAGQDGKPVLLLFTGSDWCAPCRVLEAEVTGTDAFRVAAGDVAHLVRVDVPMRPGIVSVDQLAANRTLVRQYDISGYPTLLFLSADGRPIGVHRGARTTESLLATGQRLALVDQHVQALLAAATNQDPADAPAFVRSALLALDDPNIVRRFYAKELAMAGPDVLPDRASGESSDPEAVERQRISTLKQQMTGLSRSDGLEHLIREYNTIPIDVTGEASLGSFRRHITERLIVALVDAGRIREAHVVIGAATIGGMSLQPGSFVAKRAAAVDAAMAGGDDAIEQFSRIAINDRAFAGVSRTIETMADPADRLAALAAFDGEPMTPEAEQWRQVQIGLSHEMAGDLVAARAALIRARDLPGGGAANRGYAQEQLDRINEN